MSVTSGFFDSVSGDRRYSTKQFSSLFDGIIADGVFATVGNAFAVSAIGGLEITVDTGKAWFNHTWTLNDALLPLTAEASEVMLDRIDAVILDINTSENVRQNNITIIKGEPASVPVPPTLLATEFHHQYALAYILRTHGSTEITDHDITMVVGTDETAFVTGIIDTIDITTLFSRFEYDANQFIQDAESDVSMFLENFRTLIEQAGSQVIPDGTVSRVKLARDSLYSPSDELINQNRELSSNDLGKTLQFSVSSDVTFSVPKSVSDGLPVGFEVALFKYDQGTVSVRFSGGLDLINSSSETRVPNGSAVISDKYVLIALKKLSNTEWLLTGNAQ